LDLIAAAVSTAATTAASALRLRILVAEDHPFNQKLVENLLRRKGHDIRVANDGREALAALEQDNFDLMLLDVHMPGCDGFQVIEALRRREQATGGHLPVIALTARAMQSDRERCLQAGMNGYISKPVQPAHLAATVEKFLSPETAPASERQPNQLERVLTDRLMREDSALINDLLQVFLQLAPERLGRLENAADRADAATLSLEAKKIRASAGQLASPSLVECARLIESAAGRGDFTAVKRDLATLRQEIQSLEALTT